MMPGSEINTESLELSDEGAIIPSSKRQKTENTSTQIENNSSDLAAKEKTDYVQQQNETDDLTPHSNQNLQGESKDKELSSVSLLQEETEQYKEKNCITVPENPPEMETELKLFYQELGQIESETDLVANGNVDDSQNSTESKKVTVKKHRLHTTNKVCKRIADMQSTSGIISDSHSQILTTDRPHWSHMPTRSQCPQPFIGPQEAPQPRLKVPLADQRYNVLSQGEISLQYDQRLLTNNYDCNIAAMPGKFESSILQMQLMSNCRLQSRYFHNFSPQENTMHQQVMLKPNLCQQYRQTEQLTNPAIGDKLLIFMRGPPGCGKSTLSRLLLDQCPTGVILSTDDYFCQNGGYCFDPSFLVAAHEWNQNRAKRFMDEGRSPIIIDNTNIQAWEMKPYAEMAKKRCYRMSFREPDTWWKFNVVELEKRNKHRVPREKILQMMARFEHPMSLDIVLSSVDPSYMNKVMLNLLPDPSPRWEGPLGSSSISGMTNR
ncbi:NEDD4-binding protein 2-like 2 [Rhinoraja longicauda]